MLSCVKKGEPEYCFDRDWGQYYADNPLPVKDIDVLILNGEKSNELAYVPWVDQFRLTYAPIDHHLTLWSNGYVYTLFEVADTIGVDQDPWLIIPPDRFIKYCLWGAQDNLGLVSRIHKDELARLRIQYRELLAASNLEMWWLKDEITPLTKSQVGDIFYNFDLIGLQEKTLEQIVSLFP